jgi:hypothetical protein
MEGLKTGKPEQERQQQNIFGESPGIIFLDTIWFL